jgi:hypothetical protein
MELRRNHEIVCLGKCLDSQATELIDVEVLKSCLCLYDKTLRHRPSSRKRDVVCRSSCTLGIVWQFGQQCAWLRLATKQSICRDLPTFADAFCFLSAEPQGCRNIQTSLILHTEDLPTATSMDVSSAVPIVLQEILTTISHFAFNILISLRHLFPRFFSSISALLQKVRLTTTRS